jgi:hypothetical protein
MFIPLRTDRPTRRRPVITESLIIINMVAYVRSFWADDKTVSSEVRRGASVHEAEQTDPGTSGDERTS